MVPDFITHYHPSEDAPFQSLSDVPEDELAPIIARLAARYGAGSKRVFGRRYMAYRRATETKLKALFEAVGGRPERATPHYFVLGHSAWFAGLYADAGSVRFPLDAFAPHVVSFTYPDSFVAMRLGAAFGLPLDAPQPYHDQVFRIDQLESVVKAYSNPSETGSIEAYEDYHKSNSRNTLRFRFGPMSR